MGGFPLQMLICRAQMDRTRGTYTEDAFLVRVVPVEDAYSIAWLLFHVKLRLRYSESLELSLP